MRGTECARGWMIKVNLMRQAWQNSPQIRQRATKDDRRDLRNIYGHVPVEAGHPQYMQCKHR